MYHLMGRFYTRTKYRGNVHVMTSQVIFFVTLYDAVVDMMYYPLVSYKMDKNKENFTRQNQ